jgi:hypothetical protein
MLGMDREYVSGDPAARRELPLMRFFVFALPIIVYGLVAYAIGVLHGRSHSR